jgi:Ca2+:H+ antiporter
MAVRPDRGHVAGNGRANWFKGVQLVTVYLIIALMFYLLPTAS